MTVKVSIIIPVYNVEKYLPTCLNSVLNQTFQDWEAICVNDGSPDNCAKILAEYAQKDKRIKVITQTNQGQGVARNIGLNKAEGDYIIFLDADDILFQYSVEYLYTIIQRTKATMVASRTLNKQNTEKSIPPYKYKIYRNHLLKCLINDKKIHSSPCNKIYRADVIKKHHFIPGIYFEDWPFLMSLLPDLDSYATTETPCYIYRENNVSTTRSDFNQKKVDSYLKGIQETYHFYKGRDDLRLAQKRMAIAAKMMINKVYKSKQKELQHYAKNEFKKLLDEKIIFLRDIPINTLFRIWKMK